MRKRTLLVFGIILVLALGAGSGVRWILGSLPQTRGEIRLAGSGLANRAEIRRDSRGIPHIVAGSARDGHFALGFVHAQDRMLQMEFMRRAGAGRLAEAVGGAGVGNDRFVRTLGLYALAQAQFEIVDERTREDLIAYAEGVNAWLRNRHGALPPELVALGIDPEPWRPADSLVWGKLMAVYLSGNWRDEAFRLRLLATVPKDVVDSLWPPVPSAAGMPTQAAAPLDIAVLDALVKAHPVPLGTPAGASNAWVVAGSRSADGKPLLANDPHLGFQMPIQWYLARVVTRELVLTGATVPGVPFLIVGHNGRAGWGLTATQSDVEDLFIERIDPEDPGRYLAPDGSRPFVTRREVIRVRNGDDVAFDVRATRHGIVVSDLAGGTPGAEKTVLALSAPYLLADDRTPQAIAAINRAGSAAAVEAALRDFQSPQQTVVFADTAGAIGYVAAGRVPIRATGDGRYPQPGWSGASDWAGFIPFEDLPRALDPADAAIVAANHRMVPDGYPYPLGDDFAPPYRAERIRALIADDSCRSRDAMLRVQNDSVSLVARELIPLMSAFTPESPGVERMVAMLRVWNGEMNRRRPEPLVFMKWFAAFHRELLKTVLPPGLETSFAADPLVVRNALRGEGAIRCRSENGSDCGTLLNASLEGVLKEFESENGGEVSRRHWGDFHQATFAHPLSRIHSLVARLLDRAIASDGGNDTVNRGGMRLTDPRQPFAHVHGPGLRAVLDFANLDRSLFMIATGESGNPLSPHYDDMIEDWRDGRYVRLGLGVRELEAMEPDFLILNPS